MYYVYLPHENTPNFETCKEQNCQFMDLIIYLLELCVMGKSHRGVYLTKRLKKRFKVWSSKMSDRFESRKE